MALDSPSRDTRIVSSTTTSVTMTSSNGYRTLQTTSAFSTSVIGPIIVYWQGVHSYEQGATNMTCRVLVKYSNGNTASTGAEYQVAKQGMGSNYAFGAHNYVWVFHNMPVHTNYTVEIQGRNQGNSGTTHISNYFSPSNNYGDKLIVLYQA